MLGFSLEHDSYKACLGIGSAILATAFTCCVLNNRFLMLVFCAFFAIVFCQLSEVARTSVKNPEYRQNFNQINPTGYLVGDVVYGTKRIKKTYSNVVEAVGEIKEGNDYKALGQMNYRYFFAAATYSIISVPYIVSRRQIKKTNKKNRLRKML